MDYSILIARLVSPNDIESKDCYKDRNTPGVYWVFGIIDFLQEYTIGK